MKRAYFNSALTITALLTTLSFADTERQLGAHEHGLGNLNVVQMGQGLQIELQSPLANLVGFEHPPMNDEEIYRVDSMVSTLADWTTVLQTDPKALCQLDEHQLTLPESFQQDHEDHVDHKQEDEEGHDHSDLTATWSLTCQQPVKEITVELQRSYPDFHDLNVAVLIETGAIIRDVESAGEVIELK